MGKYVCAETQEIGRTLHKKQRGPVSATAFAGIWKRNIGQPIGVKPVVIVMVWGVLKNQLL